MGARCGKEATIFHCVETKIHFGRVARGHLHSYMHPTYLKGGVKYPKCMPETPQIRAKVTKLSYIGLYQTGMKSEANRKLFENSPVYLQEERQLPDKIPV